MRRFATLFVLCVLIGTSFYPLMTKGQESPRATPTASAPEAAALPPAVATPIKPTTQPLSRFAELRGTDGYWRVGRDHAGAWWFVGPQGQAEFLNTVTTVQPYLRGRDRYGADYISHDWNPQGEHDQELDRWAKATLPRVTDAGFKGLGAW